MRPRIVITHWVHSAVVDYLRAYAEVIPNERRETPPRDLVLERARDADGIMAFMPDFIDAEFLDRCPRLKVVGAALKGYDNLDARACEERGIWLTIVPDLLTIPTAELTLGLMIGLGRNILAGDRSLRAGGFKGWEPRLYGVGLDGSTIGIVGMGAVGKALARRLSGFESNLVYFDSIRLGDRDERRLGVRPLPFDEILALSDFLAVVLPLTDQTYHLIDARAIARMKRGSLLINTGRGSTVDESAVAAALASGQLGGYAADVFEFEDWAREDRPREVHPALLDNPDKTLFTAHLGSAIDRIREAIAMEAARNIVQALRGETPEGAVNSPGVGR